MGREGVPRRAARDGAGADANRAPDPAAKEELPVLLVEVAAPHEHLGQGGDGLD